MSTSSGETARFSALQKEKLYRAEKYISTILIFDIRLFFYRSRNIMICKLEILTFTLLIILTDFPRIVTDDFI